MNNQPLNLLTTSAGDNGSGSGSSSGRSTTQLTNDERQMALASIFSSLSNLATSTQANNQLNYHHQYQHHHQEAKVMPQGNSSPQESLGHSPGRAVAEDAVTAAASSSLALSNSIQSVMAAAMMQQQLATAINQQGQQQHLNQKPLFNGEQADVFGSGLEHEAQQLGCNQLQPMPEQQQKQQQQQHRINYCTICNKELCNKYFMKTHMLKMHGINLEMEQSSDSTDGEQGIEQVAEDGESGNNGEDERDHLNSSECSSSSKIQASSSNKKLKTSTSNSSSLNKNKQATSVLNGFAGNSMGGVVCDICNKELCSKYFLKVHKQNTHGIMTDYQDAASQFVYPFAPGPMAGQLYSQPLPPNPLAGPAAAATVSFPPNPLALFGAAAAVAPANSTTINCAGQQQRTQDEPLTTKKSSAIKRSRLSQQQQQAASKQLQMAAYNPLSANIEKSGESSAITNGSQFESIYRLILAQQQQQHHQPSALSAQQQQQQAAVGSTSALLSHPPPALMPIDPSSIAVTANPLGALMCFGAMGPTGPFGPAAMSPAMIVDNILRNQHLFNRNGPTNAVGSASNQTKAIQSAKATVAAVGTDRNNNNDNSTKQGGAKVSKDSSSNSRYFSHYTEACPMCDRRFKSIKWLKTHMMNDHKQEIGAYMQMMMQYLYASNTSQQMAAAAINLAAIEQQQQQQRHHQLHQIHQIQQKQHLSQQLKNQNHRNAMLLQQQQQQQPTSLLNNCFNTKSPFSMQQSHAVNERSQRQTTVYEHRQQQLTPGHYQSRQDGLGASPLNVMAEPLAPLASSADTTLQRGDTTGFVIDARCKQESLSPGDSLINRQSPISSPPARQSLLSSYNNEHDNYLAFGLNFELSKLSHSRAAEEYQASRASPHNDIESDIGVDDNVSEDSDRLMHRADDDDDDWDEEGDAEVKPKRAANSNGARDDEANGNRQMHMKTTTKSVG